jgi:hypothetical protein
VERLFRTLQDRLIKEMRLRGIKGIDEANKFLKEYLPRYNRKFAVSAKEKADLHRQIPKDIKLDHVLCLKTERIVRNDSTVAYKSKLYQLKDKIKTRKIVIVETFKGSLTILAENKEVSFEEITERPKKQHRPKRIQPHRPSTPKANHPWRFKQVTKRKAMTRMIANVKTGHF